MSTARVIELVDVTDPKHRVVIARVRGRSANIAALVGIYTDRIDAQWKGRLAFDYGEDDKIRPSFEHELLRGN